MAGLELLLDATCDYPYALRCFRRERDLLRSYVLACVRTATLRQRMAPHIDRWVRPHRCAKLARMMPKPAMQELAFCATA